VAEVFLKNFISEPQWQKFINVYTRTRTAKASGKTLHSLVADENIWSFVVGAFFSSVKVPLLVVTSTIDRANQLAAELKIIAEDSKILSFPSIGTDIFYKNKHGNIGSLLTRLEVIKHLLEFKESRNPFIVISTANALINLMPYSKLNLLSSISLAVGSDYNREDLIYNLAKKGYERVYKVYDKGEFSVRGGIIDIFDVTQNRPVRVDFLGDNIEKIIVYDISTQEKIRDLDKVSIFPNLNPWEIEKSALDLKYDEKFSQKKLSFIDLLKEYAGKFGLVICDPLEVYLKIKSDIDMLLKSFERDEENLAIENKNIISSYIADKDFLESGNFTLKLNLISTKTEIEEENKFIFDKLTAQKKSLGNSQVFIQNLKKDIKEGKKVAISLANRERRKRIEEILLDNSISFENLVDRDKIDFKNFDPKVINILNAQLYRGYQSGHISLYGELDIYDQISLITADEKVAPVRAIEEFKPGDFVVHKTHGIGKYIDIISRQLNGYKREYFLIEYANNDKLYVPTWQADRIHKYIGEGSPKITPLDSKHWESLKKRVRKSIYTLAVDLVKLYAERETVEGFAFPSDSPWQKEIEDLFPFKETDDQAKAIDYVKKAMQKPKPMDVLVCGDVGFGKTEVAIRAAFKAIESGKQVLMLVPTTILADQHYRIFSERYKDYPVIIEVISRFKTRGEQKKIIEDFKEAKIDMLIGTHRILQDDIKPKDLGLIVIDEEQRFGVNSKEKLKLLKKEVDALTLSATPIPRTLYMSLTGIRDIVLIETHPEGRQPIETFVGEENSYIIKMAVERELARGGQVYYVYNRVRGIESKKQKLQELIPDAKIAITHGQMKSRKIEKIMEDFINKKYDVLLTTSIIESGMDIGNVNTLIVENSHKFGLSQLYQLRGRVGRSSEKAYAYFFYPSKENLNLAAFQRLKTLAEYTELGSGYNVAMRDLEIRGAGELLGARQHGHINSVGFDMYCQIMKEEIEKLKGNIIEEDLNIQIDLPVSAYIPRNYIKNEKDRINIYKMLGNADNIEKINTIRKNIEQRYGKIPFVVENLINIARIKYLMKKARIEKLVFIKSKGIVLEKVYIRRENAIKMNTRNKNLVYRPKDRQIVMKNFDKNIDLGLVLSNINDIINSKFSILMKK